MIRLEVPTAKEGHRKYAPITVEETQSLIEAIENGEIEGVNAGPYFVLNRNTNRIVGKLDLKDNQELVMLPVVQGG